MVESVDTADLKSAADIRRAGSTPALGTIVFTAVVRKTHPYQSREVDLAASLLYTEGVWCIILEGIATFWMHKDLTLFYPIKESVHGKTSHDLPLRCT